MKSTNLPTDIQALIRQLLNREIEVWLIGSRANGNSNSSSDWDFIAFGDSELVQELSATRSPVNLDLLVVTDGESFESPWPRSSDGIFKRGDLTKWQWSRTSVSTASYEGTKLPDDWGSMRKAILVEE